MEKEMNKKQNVIVTYHDVDVPAGFYDLPFEQQNAELYRRTETFEDVAGFRVDSDWIAVIDKEGGNTIIPKESVRRVQTLYV